jgi:hypothetical protein
MQKSSSGISGEPDFLPTNSKSLCLTPHSGLKTPETAVNNAFSDSA